MIEFHKKRYKMNLTIINECIFKPLIYFKNSYNSILYIDIIKRFYKNSNDENGISFTIDECLNDLQIDEKEKDVFPLVETLYLLENRQVNFKTKKREVETKFCFSLLSYLKIKNNIVEIKVMEITKEAISLLSKKDISELNIYTRFNSSYSGLIYNHILNSNETSWVLSLLQLRAYFNLKEGQYKQFSDLRNIILNTVVEEINNFSPYHITLDRTKKNNMITITWKKK